MNGLFDIQSISNMFSMYNTPIPKYSNYKGNSTKHGCNSKDIAKRRLKNKNKKTHKK